MEVIELIRNKKKGNRSEHWVRERNKAVKPMIIDMGTISPFANGLGRINNMWEQQAQQLQMQQQSALRYI